jgi:hypothetical protein
MSVTLTVPAQVSTRDDFSHTTHVRTHTPTTLMLTLTLTLTHTHVHTYTRTHVHTYTRTHVHTHARARERAHTRHITHTDVLAMPRIVIGCSGSPHGRSEDAVAIEHLHRLQQRRVGTDLHHAAVRHRERAQGHAREHLRCKGWADGTYARAMLVIAGRTARQRGATCKPRRQRLWDSANGKCWRILQKEARGRRFTRSCQRSGKHRIHTDTRYNGFTMRGAASRRH